VGQGEFRIDGPGIGINRLTRSKPHRYSPEKDFGGVQAGHADSN
jgi:hypothetical protein